MTDHNNESPEFMNRRIPKRDCKRCWGRGYLRFRKKPGGELENMLCSCVKLRKVPLEIAKEIDRIRAEALENKK